MSTKRKISTKLGQPMVKPSAKVLGKGQLNESRTVASEGGVPVKADINGFKKGEVVDISSDSESAEEDSDDGEDSASGAEEDVAMGDAEEAPVPDDTEEPAEPSFGDLVRANASEPIDVAAAFEDPSSGALSAYPHGSQIQAPVGTSLGTVLSQALKTNDVSLLESCLHTTDLNTVRATIQRLDSRLAAVLLHKLAERLHRRPGRSGSLMVWVQWTLVTHGGFLASQPDLVKRIAELNRVIDDRSKALQNLLAVKGKLDMLDAQMELRRSMQRQQGGFEDEEEDEDVIYVEGEESEEDATTNGKHLTSNGGLDDFSDGSEDSEDMPLTNGMVADSEEEDEDSEEDDLIDDEAVETDAESGDEDEVDHDDQDGEISESEEEVSAAPPKKVSRISGLFSRGKK